MTPDQTSPASATALAANLDSREAGRLVAGLLALRGSELTLDASEVRRLGAQCLQALIAAQTAWSEDGQAFRILEPSAEFRDACALMGADRLTASEADGEDPLCR